MESKRLNDICLNITDGTHSTVHDCDGTDYYLLSCKNIKQGRINISKDDRTISFNTLSQLRKRTMMSIDDVVVSSVGTIGEVAIISNMPNYEFQRSVAILKPNSNLVLPKYLMFYLTSFKGQSQIKSRVKGAAQPCLFLSDIRDICIDLPTIEEQQHIVNTIGSADDLIENLTSQNEKIFSIGLTTINRLNETCRRQLLSSICKFEKGFEVGSKQYIDGEFKDGLIRYLRVGDLLSEGSTFLKPTSELVVCKFEDILIAFDGAPGRNAFGLEGAYSSGIYKVICEKQNKGFIFFELNSELNRSIIKNHSQGTTILHAGKSIQFLECCKAKEEDIKTLSSLFKLMVLNKDKIKYLKRIKQELLTKYF